MNPRLQLSLVAATCYLILLTQTRLLGFSPPVSFYFVPQLSSPELSGWPSEQVSLYLHEASSVYRSEIPKPRFILPFLFVRSNLSRCLKTWIHEVLTHIINQCHCAGVIKMLLVLIFDIDLLGVLLEQAELEALIQLELADVPGLVEVLPGGVQFVQQLGDPWHQALGVGVAHPAAPAAAAAAAAAAAPAAAVAVGEGLAALDPLEQPAGRFNASQRSRL